MKPKHAFMLWAAGLTTFFAVAVLWPRTMMEKAPSPCMFRYAFHCGCPGCGMTRSVTSLMQGDLRRSVEMHLFGPVIVAIAAGMWIRSVAALFQAAPRPFEFSHIRWTIGLAVFLTLYIGYWIYRVMTHTTP